MGIQLNGSSGADIISSSDGTITIDGTSTVSTPIVTDTITISDKISHTGDPNTHIRFAGDDTVTVETAGSERLRVDSNGNIGVNCDSPTNISNSRGITIQGASSTPAGFINFMDYADNSDGRILADNGHLTITADASDNTADSSIRFNVDGTSEKLRITNLGQVSISGAGTTFGNAKLNIAPANRTTAFDPAQGATWHDVVLLQGGSATNNAVGIAFELKNNSSYHHNAGTGIAAVKNGTNSDYGSDLVFITRPQSAVAAERLRIKSNGDIVATGNIKTNNLPGRNILYNGAMQITQRATNATGLSNTNNYPTADRWRLISSNAGTYTADIMNDGPANTGLRKSFKLSCTTANNAGESNLANADGYLAIEQRLEGYDVQCLKKGGSNAESLSISFWCKSNQTGTYNVELYDVDNARRVGSQFTVNSSGTWEYKTFTFAGDTTGGTLSNDDTDTFRFRIFLAAGNNFRTGTNSGVWAANVTNQKAQNNQSLSRTQGNYWMMTGAKLEIGSLVTEYDHKSYGEELALCQRYCVVYGDDDEVHLGIGVAYSSANINLSLSTPVTMRSQPAISKVTSGGNWLQSYVGATGHNSNASVEVGEKVNNNIRVYCQTTGHSLSVGQGLWCQVLPNAKLILSSEL